MRPIGRLVFGSNHVSCTEYGRKITTVSESIGTQTEVRHIKKSVMF